MNVLNIDEPEDAAVTNKAAVTPPPLTALQEALVCEFDCFRGNRATLSAEEWSAYVWVSVELFVREASRLAVDEALRATREEADE